MKAVHPMNKTPTKKEWKISGRTLLVLLVLCILLLTAALFASWWFLFHTNVLPVITVEAGTPSVSETNFLKENRRVKAEFQTDLATVNLSRPGDYPLQIRYFLKTYDVLLQVRDTTPPTAELQELSTLAPAAPAAEDFVVSVSDVTNVTVQFAAEPAYLTHGDQPVTIRFTDESGNVTELQTVVHVTVDDTAPVLEGIQPMTIYLGQEPDYLGSVTITDDIDAAPILTLDDSGVDLTQGGVYPVIYRGLDSSGNESMSETTLTILVDNLAPVIYGINPISLYAGGTVSYRSGIIVTDDQDESPQLTIDSSQVNLSQAGVYEVIYTATDAAGNATVFPTTVTVSEKPANWAEPETIYAMADELLLGIVTDTMTDREKVQAIYRYMHLNFAYLNYADKTDALQAAYLMMTNRGGDCYSYFALSKLFFDRLGIPNINVVRIENPYRRSKHYWSLVSVDGGETYYHFDCTPRSTTANGTRNFCLVTDAYLVEYMIRSPGYYIRDMSLYPPTPES